MYNWLRKSRGVALRAAPSWNLRGATLFCRVLQVRIVREYGFRERLVPALLGTTNKISGDFCVICSQRGTSGKQRIILMSEKWEGRLRQKAAKACILPRIRIHVCENKWRDERMPLFLVQFTNTVRRTLLKTVAYRYHLSQLRHSVTVQYLFGPRRSK